MMFLVLFAIHSLLIIANQIEAGPQGRIKVVRRQSGPGLYSSSNGIVILNANNFNENVYNSSSASLVQFYHSPSDHCLKFAPLYQQLGSSIQNWKNIVKIASIDCADSQNIQLCQQHEIKDYPALRYFPPLLDTATSGKPISKDVSDAKALEIEIVRQLMATQPKMANFPDFSPVNSDNFESVRALGNGQLMIVIIEEEDSHFGHELMMDLHGVKNVMVRSSHNLKLSNSKDKLPQIYVLKSGYPPKQLALINPSRYRVFKLVQSYLLNEGYIVPDIVQMQGGLAHNISHLQMEAVVEHLENSEELEKVLAAYAEVIGALANVSPNQQKQQNAPVEALASL